MQLLLVLRVKRAALLVETGTSNAALVGPTGEKKKGPVKVHELSNKRFSTIDVDGSSMMVANNNSNQKKKLNAGA